MISSGDEVVGALPVVAPPEVPPEVDEAGTVVPVVGGLAGGLAGLDIVTEGAETVNESWGYSVKCSV